MQLALASLGALERFTGDLGRARSLLRDELGTRALRQTRTDGRRLPLPEVVTAALAPSPQAANATQQHGPRVGA